ncbi:MAG: hypothetical protein KC897_07920 [Candidatus Omnitrophica bacterium]|nr:hypothetical protein [Candidatus Omnitrophota bacterium]MCB9719647.1 hypothetical protein [Candidatus Omnitrophota bacterium]
MKWRGITCALLIILAGFLSYANSFDNSFQFDGYTLILENPAVRDVFNTAVWRDFFQSHHRARFIGFLSLGFNYYWHQDRVFGYHVVNWLIHLVNAGLVFGMVSLIGRTPRMDQEGWARQARLIALIAALIFVTHPLQTQAVTYIYQRLTSVAALFYLLTVNAYLKGRLAPAGAGTKYYILAAVSAVLGMFSKETVFTLPVMIFCAERYFFPSERRKSFWTYLPLAFLLVIPLILLFDVGHVFKPRAVRAATHAVVDSRTYLLTQFNVIVTYLRLLIFPVGQSLEHDFPVSRGLFDGPTWINLLALLGLAGLAFKMRRTQRLISFGIVWFFVALAVESSIIPLRYVIAEHRLYLPLAGFSVAAAAAMVRWLPERVALSAGLSAALVLGCLTFQRNAVWQDEVTLWSDVVRQQPQYPYGHFALGVAYQRAGRPDDAYREYAITLQQYDQTQKILDIELLSEIYNNMGILDYLAGKDQPAEAHLLKALEYRPDFPKALANLGRLYYEHERYTAAERYLTAAVEKQRNFPHSYFYLGLTQQRLGNRAGARQSLQSALSLFARQGDEKMATAAQSAITGLGEE